MNHHKYEHYLDRFEIPIKNRQWPDQRIVQAPRWCSVDLRDGNQALINPMTVVQKRRLFELLLQVGFKEIELGFPSASATEFEFMRQLIETNALPTDVIPQVLVQAKAELIKRTIDSLQGAPRAIVHLYNSTSATQRKVVFRKDEAKIIELAVAGIKCLKELAKETDTKIQLQYSPESFTGTELPFAKQICEAVIEAWQPSGDEKVIINLPATVEMSTPNIFADQVEWFSTNVAYRDQIILSIHTHNDRGTGVASAELGIMAGAERVEGTLFGYGERTGNVDLATLALNIMTQGVDPALDLTDLPHIAATIHQCTGEQIHPRHPYIGELVFTAFSGSHQDAISKGVAHQAEQGTPIWDVPYIPVDPLDIGREFKGIIRINGQSGRGGIAHVFAAEFGIKLTRKLSQELAQAVQIRCDQLGSELTPEQLWALFDEQFLQQTAPLQVVDYSVSEQRYGFKVMQNSKTLELKIEKQSRGIVECFVESLNQALGLQINIDTYSEQSIGKGSDTEAISICTIVRQTKEITGAAVHRDTLLSSLQAICSAVNRSDAR